MNVGSRLMPGEEFSWRGLTEVVGAGGQSCLLHTGVEVVAIAMVPEKNPDAPNVLLVGRGRDKERYAQELAASQRAVPVFVKLEPDRWRFAGHFRAGQLNHDPAAVAFESRRARRDDVWGILPLDRVEALDR